MTKLENLQIIMILGKQQADYQSGMGFANQRYKLYIKQFYNGLFKSPKTLGLVHSNISLPKKINIFIVGKINKILSFPKGCIVQIVANRIAMKMGNIGALQ